MVEFFPELLQLHRYNIGELLPMEEERESNISSSANISPLDLNFTASSSMPSGVTMHNFLQVPQTPHSEQQINSAMHHVETAAHSQTPDQLDQFIQLQNRHMELFWQHQRLELDNPEGYSQHHLPLSRIRRIMKMEGNAQLVSADTPMMFSKACEYFISELTIRAWLHAERCQRNTIKRNDIAGAVCSTDTMDFLIDILPQEDIQDCLIMKQHQDQQQDMAAEGRNLSRHP